MTFHRVLLAIDDSPAALRAAEVALELAQGWRADVRIVTVGRDHTLAALLETGRPRASERVEDAGAAVVEHVANAARARDLAVEAVQRAGEPFEQILDEARSFHADIIVMGRSDRQGPSSPYVGSVAAHVLEFAECPVLIVPRPGA